ncbi:MAG: hypothetical protein K8W52_38645, partial [Deltaproteobacteria bacterium]|nr:hypothetical protein [Deltaproteobacteria bacterium]
MIGCGGDAAPPGAAPSDPPHASPSRRQQGAVWAAIEADLERARAELIRAEAEAHDARLALVAAGAADRRAAQDRLDAAEQARRAAEATYDRIQARAMEFSIARPPEDRHQDPRRDPPRILSSDPALLPTSP